MNAPYLAAIDGGACSNRCSHCDDGVQRAQRSSLTSATGDKQDILGCHNKVIRVPSENLLEIHRDLSAPFSARGRTKNPCSLRSRSALQPSGKCNSLKYGKSFLVIQNKPS